MNVPLSATPVSYGGVEKLKIWCNGTQTIIDTKIKPYFYSYEDLHIGAKKSTVNAIALSTYQKKKFFKYEFNTRRELYEQKRSGVTFEDSISEGILYVIRNRIDMPNLFTRFPNSDDLKFLFFDIEQYTKPNEMFPTYDDRIISIAFCTNDKKIKTICLKKTTTTDKALLEKFIEEYEKINPDVLVVYNKTYDIPTLINRCIASQISTTSFSKNKTKPFLNRKNVPFIDGVVVYDVYDSARDDQTLTGNVENRGLKAVSDYFDFKGEREPLKAKHISEYIGTKELIDYNRDDVKRLLWLFDIYWPGIEYTANDLKVPLNLALDMSITKLGLIVMGDEYKKRNIIADGRNYDRYPQIFQRKKKIGEPNYRGALVDIARTGLFIPLYKADYSSMYPKIMSEFNLSPDTTTLLMFEPYGEFKIVEEENAFVYYIPDDVLKKTMVIQVLKKPGFFALLVKKFLDERSEEKTLFKKTGDKEHETKSNNSKVKANGGVYGNQGSANHPFGFAPIAVATCGIGRECAQLLIDILNKLYPNCVIEWDSVTGDTPVFIRNKGKKEIDIIPIEDLSDGSLRNYVDGIETLTRAGWKNLEYVYCHEVDKMIYTVDTRGARIDVTGDHSLFSNGKTVLPKDLKKNDVIDIYPQTDFGGNSKKINKEMAWFLGFFLSDGTITVRNRNKEIKKRFGAQNNFCKIGTSYELKIGNLNLSMLEHAKTILKNEFGLDSKIYDIGNVPNYRYNYYKLDVITKRKNISMKERSEYSKKRKRIIRNIINMCYCKDKKTKKVPKQILNASNDTIVAFFDGLTDGDGHIVTNEKGFGMWSFGGKFKPFIAGVAYLLDRRGITYNMSCRKDKLNITQIRTHKPKEFCTHNVKKGHPGIVTKVLKERKKQNVYDLSTEDGTFVAGIGRVICHNTDGIYFTINVEKFNKNIIIDEFNKQLKQKFGKDLNLTIDIDKYDAGYFYKAKNYLLKKGDKIIYHGVAMKARSKDALSKNLIQELAKAKLNNKPILTIMKKYKKLDFPLKDFAMNITMGMPLFQYKNKNSLAPRLAIRAEKELGIKIQPGNQYYYVKQKDDYELLELTSLGKIDKQYYMDEVIRILKMFDTTLVVDNIDKWL